MTVKSPPGEKNRPERKRASASPSGGIATRKALTAALRPAFRDLGSNNPDPAPVTP